ncbi:alpha/beta hydrolase [Flammeovirga pectinis]|uniref:Alpha/beta hydrolase n=1 Tax=Flammeovirga pectinis TaxID=2494373 RepID=A0A3Q9FT56_9BACT|nr:alpha/beta hydrolase [Flammeovirga pectinis]AZQ63874.1 alpha/beta hydrolase [Flammeovirga pectinis]
MKQSLAYYIILLVIKLKGIKRDFSKVPIDFKKIRKEDVKLPNDRFFKKHILKTFKVSESLITEIGCVEKADKLLIFIHGGAFISGPTQHHWDTIKEIAKRTNYTIWMCDYPKAPENQIAKISENIDAIYSKALKNYQPNHIAIIGDSVGGTLATALTQRLKINKIELPAKLILVSPVMDASMSNPAIDSFEKLDPMLSRAGVLSAKKMCAGTMDLKDPMISPLYGDFEGFPETILFLSQNDIMYSDTKLAELKMKNANVNLEVIEGKNMPHIWPFLPVMKEAQDSLKEIIRRINTI